jgi:hypothetical protein
MEPDQVSDLIPLLHVCDPDRHFLTIAQIEN